MFGFNKPTLPVEFRFFPREDFEWVEQRPDGTTRLVGCYHPGAGYNCTSEPRHDALRGMCLKWLREGKIEIMALPAGMKFASRSGT